MAYPASVGRPVTDRAAALHIGHMLSRVALTGTIVRLGEALPVVFFSSAVDFILPVNCRPACGVPPRMPRLSFR